MSKVRMTTSVIMGVIIVVAVFFGVYSFAVAKVMRQQTMPRSSNTCRR